MDCPFDDLMLFITGPTWLRPEVRAAGAWPEFGHRDSENANRFFDIFRNLGIIADLPDGYQTIILPGSGSTGMEAAIRSMVSDDETIMHVTIGAFGDLWYKISQLNGKKTIKLSFPAGTAVEIDSFEKALKRHKPAVVAITHNETSTGVMNDIVSLTRLAKKYNALVLVDGVSIFGGAPSCIRESGCDIYCTATQKCLGLPAGFGIVFVSPEAVEKSKSIKNKGYTTDLLAHLPRAAKYQTLSTPNGTLANQMWLQLQYIVGEESVDKRFLRHQMLRGMVTQWTKSLPEGFKLFAPEDAQSLSLTTVQCPVGMTIADLKQVKEALRLRGYLFDPGYGKLNEALQATGNPLIIRIAHMGDTTFKMMEDYLATLDEVIRL